MVDFQNRKKVYILCGKESYATIWEHLHEIINVQEEELIIPYDFMEPEKIDKRIEEAVIDYLHKGGKNAQEERLRQYSNWYEKKFTHFKTYISDASIIILTRHSKLRGLDSQELFKELEYCENLKDKKFCIIDIEQLTHQKTIK